MGFDEGRIVLDSENGVYFAGQMVQGKLIFNQEKVKTFRGIYARMKGFCEVEWTTTHTRRVNDRTETYTEHHGGREVYFEIKQYLVGSEHGETSINSGHHEFPFEFHIPAHCPSSFEGTYGHIRYEIKVVVDRAFKLDQTKKAAVRVVSPLNLNSDPYCREPMHFEFQESFCCWCVSSGSCETIVKLPVSGYCPGQVIPIEVSCTNNSGVDMEDIVFTIKKYLEFRATDGTTKDESDVIAKLKKGPVAAHTTRNWTVEMPVPVVDPYNLHSCQYISLDYKFKVEIETGACHTDADQSRRIVIGSVPLVGFQDDYRNPLQDQMPQLVMPVVNQQPAPYPNPALNNQPYANPTGYPGMNPSENPPPYPGLMTPFPNAPYPAPSAYPGANPPYAGANPPYPGANPPYPGANPPYPGTMPGANMPYSSAAPDVNPPYPGFKENKTALGGEIEPQPAYNPSVYKH